MSIKCKELLAESDKADKRIADIAVRIQAKKEL